MNSLFEGDYKHEFPFSVSDMARIILSAVHWDQCDEKEFGLLIENLNLFVHNAPFDSVSLPASTTNMTIINRYLARSVDLTYSLIKRGKWDPEEDDFIEKCIYSRQEDQIYAQFLKTRSTNAIRARIQLKRKEKKLNQRKKNWKIKQ